MKGKLVRIGHMGHLSPFDMLVAVSAFEIKTGLKPAELAAIIAPYDALLIRSGTKVTREVVEHATSLKVIGRAGVGVDNVDLEPATRRGIVVMNSPTGNSVTTAEHAISMMMAVAR